MTGDSAMLLLADGSSFEGWGLGPAGLARGEAVFYTGMTGYEEALTDPSYAGQLLVFSYPLIGNYGIDAAVRQHRTICAAGCVCRRASRHPSHHRSSGTLGDWLSQGGVPAAEGVDTRALVTRLREAGSMFAVLAVGAASIENAPAALQSYMQAPGQTPMLVRDVSSRERSFHRQEGRPRVVLLDCGTKAGIPEQLSRAGAEVVVVPFDTEFDELLALRPDGLVISNGPGDPSEMKPVVQTLRRVIDYAKLPSFGVCFGHQLLALALGAKTFKLKYGHRGSNQPVRVCQSDDVMITAHNHGYAVDASSLPQEVEQTMINLNDGTNEGLRHCRLPIASVQFHPEASPGPADAGYLLADFVSSLKRS
ncbi:MAG: glutamine-hydrolyzing carbamoyl-phosphate synthase small subunit [Candidatus Eremiobacteraeota bacterium]|nr:glutamine-hydrolyzing carbamoyl-phosphate synthase small subunit [Candidatus Eremiobacteraeota bacterium]